MRLDAFLLAHAPSSTRGLVREAIRRGVVTVNGGAAPKGGRIGDGDTVAAAGLPEARDNRVRPDAGAARGIAGRVVHEDAWLIGVDKPAGMAVQPLSLFEDGTLAGAMVALHPEVAGVGDEPLIAGAVHRIDAGTSGLVLFARDNATFAAMRALFAARGVVKKYLALVEGAVAGAGAVACELAHAPHLDHCRMVAWETLSAGERRRARPLFAETRFTPLRRIGGDTLLSVEITTGVTHQIRAQLAMAGHPIAGDKLYGAAVRHGGEFMLRSLSAQFRHPATGRETLVKVPELPD